MCKNSSVVHKTGLNRCFLIFSTDFKNKREFQKDIKFLRISLEEVFHLLVNSMKVFFWVFLKEDLLYFSK